MKVKITIFLFFLTLCYQQVNAQCSGFDFEEVNGIAILEVESKVSGDWRKESSSQASGGSALTYRGSNYFSSPGNSTITYKLKINSPGTYRFIWRSNITIIAATKPNTEHNDSWLKIKGSNFFGKRGTSIVYPGGSGKTPVAKGATSGGWFKIYTSSLGWNWTTLTSDNDGHSIYATFNSAGTYDIQISGRSNGHSIDRMVLYKEGSYTSLQAQSLSRAATNCSGNGTTTPPPTEPTTPTTPTTPPSTNQSPTVSITSPTVGQSISAGSNVAINLSANDADGSISAHEIYINNTRVDRDGPSYTPHIIENIQAGTYAVRAVVTDNSGATASATVSITVGTGSTTQPNPPTNPNPPTSGNTAPTVQITSPTTGQVIAPGAEIPIQLSANDANGSVVRHQVFINNRLVDTDGSNYTPHPFQENNSGSYAIRVIVTDNQGATASAEVNITVGTGSTTQPNPPTNPTPPSSGNTAPTVQITSPTTGQVIVPGTRVPIQLSTNDANGSVVRHQVFINNKLVDTDGSNYTPHPFQESSLGSYVIRVVVTDNQGATGSAEVNITVGTGSNQPSPPPTTPSTGITFDLINASTNNVISAITNGTNISAANAQGMNIRANVSSSQVRSVVFSLTGSRTANRTEGLAPYALFGDIGNNYIAENLSNGSYSLTAFAYSGGSASGQLLSQATISFTVGLSTSKTAVAFPNPIQSDGKVSLRLPEGATGLFNYIISNSAGVPLEQGRFSAQPEVRDVELELQNVGRQSPGVYYLNLMSLDSKQTIPLIKK